MHVFGPLIYHVPSPHSYDVDDGTTVTYCLNIFLIIFVYDRYHRDHPFRLVCTRGFIERQCQKAHSLYRYHSVSPVLLASGVPPTSDSTLINGLGRYSGDTTATLAVISVVEGKRYRFRLVSLSCDPNYVFSIDNHTMVSRLPHRIMNYSN